MLIELAHSTSRSLFGASEFDPLNKGLLSKEEGNDNWHRKNNRSSHQLIPDYSALTLKVLQTERHREVAWAGETEQGAGEIVPGPQEGEHGHGGKDRDRKRNHETGEYLPFRSAIHAGVHGQ